MSRTVAKLFLALHTMRGFNLPDHEPRPGGVEGAAARPAGPADGRGQATAGTSLAGRPCSGPLGSLTSKATATPVEERRRGGLRAGPASNGSCSPAARRRRWSGRGPARPRPPAAPAARRRLGWRPRTTPLRIAPANRLAVGIVERAGHLGRVDRGEPGRLDERLQPARLGQGERAAGDRGWEWQQRP